jgi:hypothetical protein
LASYLERIENMDDDDDDEYSYGDDELDDDDDELEIEIEITDSPITEESLDSEAFLEEVEQFLRSQHDD